MTTIRRWSEQAAGELLVGHPRTRLIARMLSFSFWCTGLAAGGLVVGAAVFLVVVLVDAAT